MFDRTLHRYCRSIARSVPIPRPFSVQALCRELTAQTSRRIYLHPYPQGMSGPDMPCGVWVATAAADHIFFESNTSQYHQTHIILHEIGHMLCRHSMNDIASGMIGSIDDDGVTGTLQRTSYTTRQEREAELVASMILERAMGWDSEAADAEERYLGEALGFI